MTQQFIPLLGTQENWKHRNLYMKVHVRIIHNIQKAEIIQMCINWQMSKVWYII